MMRAAGGAGQNGTGRRDGTERQDGTERKDGTGRQNGAGQQAKCPGHAPKIKLCGLSRPQDILAANALMPDYIGFVFAKKSRRYVTQEQAAGLRALLAPGILAVGVFVDTAPEDVAALLNAGLIDAAQLHGHEDGAYIRRLRALTKAPLIQAFRMDGESDVRAAEKSPADFVLLDAGNGGTGSAFDWSLARKVRRPYFLAGGLAPENVGAALKRLSPYGVDVSSAIVKLLEKYGKEAPRYVGTR